MWRLEDERRSSDYFVVEQTIWKTEQRTSVIRKPWWNTQKQKFFRSEVTVFSQTNARNNKELCG